MSRRRAAVLIGLHLLVAAHLAHWYATGRTLTPLEPSEGMQYALRGVLNAGAIFFALAILSTLVLGRFFCGWACHLVALQDLCRWLLRRIGIRPRAMRSRLLLWAPLLAFFYMFVFPLIQRWHAGEALGATLAPAQLHLTTDRFWETFPGWFVGGLTLLTCGFVIVYFLGSKGFCTYGCPYGGIFGLVEGWAPLRIRVTDACEGCGHCTSACTSNVRVHEEVRDYGMVIDPGCMKCMDCVSVCPNDALYYGFGRPAIFNRAARPARRDKSSLSTDEPPARGAAPTWRVIAEALLFSACCFAAARLLFAEAWQAMPVWGWGLLSVVMGVLTSRRRGDYSLVEEAALAGFFLLGFAAFRGLYGAVPFLMSLGVAAMLAFLALQLVRMATQANVRLQQWSLRRGGRITPAGRFYVLAMTAVLAFWLHCGAVQWWERQAAQANQATMRFAPPLEQALAPSFALTADQRAVVERGRKAATRLQRWGLTQSAANQVRLAWLAILMRDVSAAHEHMTRAVTLRPDDPALRREFSRFLTAAGRPEDAVEQLAAAARVDAETDSALALARLLGALGRFDRAEAALDDATHKHGERPEILHALAVVEMGRGRPLEAVANLQRAIGMDPELGGSRALLGEILLALGHADEAMVQLKEAARLLPRHAGVHYLLGRTLAAAGDEAGAEFHLAEAVRFAPDRSDYARALAQFNRTRGPAQKAAEPEDRSSPGDPPGGGR